MQDDAALLIRYSQDRSNEAFTELVRRHLNFVYRTALRQVAGDTHLAEDVAQSVFADLARKARAIADCPVLARWLYTSTHHAASKAVRSEQRRRSRERIAQAVQELSNHPAHDAEWVRIRPRLDEALRGLSQRDGDAILLRFFEARSFAAIGAQLGLNENAARMRVERALDKLRDILSRRGITSTTAALAAMLANEAIGAAPAGLATVIADAALASPAVGSGTAAIFFQFMSMTKLALIAGILAIGVGIYQVREAGSAEAVLRTAQGEFTAQRESLRVMQQSALTGNQSLAGLRPTGGNPPAAHPTSQNPQEEAHKFLTAFPAARGMLSDIFAVETATFYRPFFKSIEMSSSEIKKFEDAVVNARLANLTLTPRGFGDTETPALLPPDDQLRGILGEQQYQQFQDFLLVQPAFSFADQAAIAAGLAGEPLSTDQEDQLVQVLVKNTPLAQGGSVDLSAVNWDTVLPRAQAMVSATQWNAIQADFIRMQYGQALAAAKGSGASAGSSPSR